MACSGLAGAVVGSPLAPRLAPQDSAGFATLICADEGQPEGRAGGEPAWISVAHKRYTAV